MSLRAICVAGGLLLLTCGHVQAEVIRMAGSGGMIPLVNELAAAYMKKHPGVRVEVNQKSLGKEGGVMALVRGAIDIGMLASLERKDKKAPIVPIEIAMVPGLFAVHPGVPVRALTSRQICDIYAGRIVNWKQLGGKDARIVVLTRPENESTKIAVRQGVGCFATLTESQAAVMIEKSLQMNATIPKTPNSIGMINSVALEKSEGGMAAVALDGKDVLRSGTRWPIMHRFYLATRKNAPAGVMNFIRFVTSPEGEKVLRQEKAYPAR